MVYKGTERFCKIALRNQPGRVLSGTGRTALSEAIGKEAPGLRKAVGKQNGKSSEKGGFKGFSYTAQK